MKGKSIGHNFEAFESVHTIEKLFKQYFAERISMFGLLSGRKLAAISLFGGILLIAFHLSKKSISVPVPLHGLERVGVTQRNLQSLSHSEASNHETSNDFCNGMSMIMAMSGFQWSLFEKGQCLTYFVAPWKLDGSGKFLGAMVYSFLLALLTEGITWFQRWIGGFLSGKVRRTVMAILYAIQHWLGYMIMFIAMTYSYELLGCVLLGLMAGRSLLSNHKRDHLGTSRRRGRAHLSMLSSSQSREEETPLVGEAESTVRRRRR